MSFGHRVVTVLGSLVLAMGLQACQSMTAETATAPAPGAYGAITQAGYAGQAQGLPEMASAYAEGKAGVWRISDHQDRTECSLTLTTETLDGSTLRAVPAGHCSMDYDDIGGWMAQGDDIVLTDHTGGRLGLLERDAGGTYSGHFDAGYFGAARVYMNRDA